MKLQLAQNIRKLRKERHMTQEQLAEVLRVSAGVISKWELGLSLQEVDRVAELAEWFGLSVDALLGLRPQDRSRNDMLEQMKGLLHDRQQEVDFSEVEHHLLRYPNDFEMVYRAARLYATRGLAKGERDLLGRGLTLLQRACGLIEQNTDEAISLLSLQGEIAGLYQSLGRDEEALELLRRNNPCGVNHERIGLLLSSKLHRPEEALPYLSEALMHSVYARMDIAVGLVNAYEDQKRFAEARDVLHWICQDLQALCLPRPVGPLHRFLALYQAIDAGFALKMGDSEEAREALRQARMLARSFDAAPTYDAAALKFVELSHATVYDDFGDTAIRGIEEYLRHEDRPELTALWEEMEDENE